jgi:hypothetical protein
MTPAFSEEFLERLRKGPGSIDPGYSIRLSGCGLL